MLEYHDHGLELSNQEVLICLLEEEEEERGQSLTA
jgi:hypothetical protein